MKPQFNPSTNHYLNPSQLHNQFPSQQSMYQNVAAAANSAEISIKTKEGDVISISQDYTSQLLEEYSVSQSTSSSLVAAYESQGFSFSVQGDLNEQELQDLSDLLFDLNDIASHFFSGNMGTAINEAMNLGDMGSIAQLEASFSRTTLLSQYMSGPHPIPDLSEALYNFFPERNHTEEGNQPKTPSFAETMRAQFAQLLDYLAEQNAIPYSEQINKEEHNDLQATSNQMLARSQETMTQNPRLTPLLPALSDLAINNAYSYFEQTPQGKSLFSQLKETFARDFKDWII